jgi:conjugal transfer ATP-binding protein TraC
MKIINQHKSIVKEAVLSERMPSPDDMPTKKTLQAMSDRYTLSSVLPYERYDEGHELYYNTDTYGFMVYCSPSTGLVSEDLTVLEGIFKTIYPENASIQISLISDSNIEPILDHWADGRTKSINLENDEIFRILAANRIEHLKKGKWKSLIEAQPYILRNYHLIVTLTLPYEKGENQATPTDVEKLQRLKGAFISTLSTAKIPAKNFTPNHFINIMNGILNPSTKIQPHLEYDEDNLIANQIVSRDTSLLLGASGATLSHDDEHYSILPFHVRQFPKNWKGVRNSDLIGMFRNDILRIGCPFILTLNVSIPDQTSIKSKAVTHATRATQMADSPMARFMPQWSERKIDWQYTVDQMENGDKLLESCYQVILITPKGTEQACEENLKSLYSSIGWQITKSRYTILHALLSALPMGASQDIKQGMKTFKYYTKNLASTCTNISPLVAEWKGHKSPMMLLSGRRGQIAYFDPFENDKGNYNMSCAATSGSGKSFLTQDWIFNCLGGGGRAFVIDAGHSYRNLNKLLGGTYIDFGDNTKQLCINPFTNIDSDDKLMDGIITHFQEQLPMLKTLIVQMATGDRPLTKKEEVFIERAIVESWKEKCSDATMDDVVRHLKVDKIEENDRDATGLDLAVMLHSYTKDGMYGRYLNGKNNIDLNNPFVVMDLDALNKTPDLQAVALLMLMMQITQTMYLTGNKAQRKLCIIDEAWRLMAGGSSGASSHAAKTIEEGYRVARKHGGSFMTITQRISDYYKSETTKAALMNSDFIIYLRQKPEELTSAIAAGYIDNSDGKIEVLRSLETKQGQYSEMAISSPDGLSVFRFITDKVTEKVYSTSPTEVEFLKQKQASGSSLFEAIQELIAA